MVSSLPYKELKCRRNSDAIEGYCVIQSDECCESYRGETCVDELNKRIKLPAPQLEFLENSLVIDTNLQLLCFQGLKIAKATPQLKEASFGIHLQVEVIKTDSTIKYKASNTILVQGPISPDALEKGLFCTDMKFNAVELEDSPNMHFIFSLTTLPKVDGSQQVVQYMFNDSTLDIPSAIVPRVHIDVNNCREWRLKDPKHDEEEKSNIEVARDELSNKTNILMPTEDDMEATNKWPCSIMIAILATLGMFFTGLYCLYRHQIGNKKNCNSESSLAKLLDTKKDIIV